ncbi:MAG: transglycosylase domain-containing protein [Rhodopseudomonas palustris]|nr:transglycosylase domain-containing protein [Rhodopseudomonas palustris]
MRGASTITQQVMKNFLLSGDRTGERKIKEIILATRIEETLSKDKILELYLNEIFLGQNSYGVAAAAQTYFNKTLAAACPGRGRDACRQCRRRPASIIRSARKSG